MAFHIQHAYLQYFKKVFALFNDVDVLILLLNHIQSSCNHLGPLYMRLGNGTMGHAKNFLCSLHILLTEVGSLPVKMLPALDALSGYDTTSKVGPKSYCLYIISRAERLLFSR